MRRSDDTGADSSHGGVWQRTIEDTPLAVIDMETTGLIPGRDRIVEISVVRIEPDGKRLLAFDSLLNPSRKVSAIDVHGITEKDIRAAPTFEAAAAEIIDCISDSVLAAYHASFDVRFLVSELDRVGVSEQVLPHLCLMLMRPLLGLGGRCRLDEACEDHGIDFEAAHIASSDARAASGLLGLYLNIFRERDIRTFSDLAGLGSYKFLKSLSSSTLPGAAGLGITKDTTYRLVARSNRDVQQLRDQARADLRSYWNELMLFVEDFVVTEEELDRMWELKSRLSLTEEQIRALHTRAFLGAAVSFTCDDWLDDREAWKLRQLHEYLATLGWAPGQ